MSTANAPSLLARIPTSAILLVAVLFNALGDNLCSSIVRPDSSFIQTLKFAFGVSSTTVFTNGNHLHFLKTTFNNDDKLIQSISRKNPFTHSEVLHFHSFLYIVHTLYPSNQSKYSCFTKGSSNKQTSNYIWIQSRIHTLLVFSPSY